MASCNQHIQVSSDEINYLIYRYLMESGYDHSAYLFGAESNINIASVNPNSVPVGSLVTLIQKSLTYIECEVMFEDSDRSLLPPISLIDAVNPEFLEETKKQLVNARAVRPQVAVQAMPSTSNNLGASFHDENSAMSASEFGTFFGGSSSDSPTVQISPPQVTRLEGHQSEIFMCSWNPHHDLLASGSADSTTRIWDLTSGGDSSQHLILKHNPSFVKPYGDSEQLSSNSSSAISNRGAKPSNQESQSSITSLDWNIDGERLATGSYDGIARIWSKDGTLLSSLAQHNGPIFALKWNPSGDFVLSAGIDQSTIVWRPPGGSPSQDKTISSLLCKPDNALQQFKFHGAPALDVDWKCDTVFASCSTDKFIHVCEIGKDKPIKTFSGHQNEVNAVRWCPQGKFLASCADDHTLKLWTMASDTYLHSLTGHAKEIYQIRWSPSGPGTPNPNVPLYLASASFDTTIRVWDMEKGQTIRILKGHTQPVYSVAFSPDSKLIGSGSLDNMVFIWDHRVKNPIKSFRGSGGIYEVAFNSCGDKIGVASSDGNVFILDLR